MSILKLATIFEIGGVQGSSSRKRKEKIGIQARAASPGGSTPENAVELGLAALGSQEKKKGCGEGCLVMDGDEGCAGGPPASSLAEKVNQR